MVGAHTKTDLQVIVIACLTACALCLGSSFGQTIPLPDPIGDVVDPPIPLESLKTAENPIFPGGQLRPDLVEFIADKDAAIQLGKAFYWDMQASSDNRVACATCHFHAGADGRASNQLNPGFNGEFDVRGANNTLRSGDFPFTDINAGIDADDAVGSQGIRKSQFLGMVRGGVEAIVPVSDPVFTANGKNVRQVGRVNAPTVINSVFNHRNFWNGRAQSTFNGVNHLGDKDVNARVWSVGPNGNPVSVDIHIKNASLASQAVGPPLNVLEMSAAVRTFLDVGKKMLRVSPLRLQRVLPTDSVLGPLVDKRKGLKISYARLIRRAFQPMWWDSRAKITIDGQPYSMMEANFSLYWGLSIMLYEATLVSDDTPIDRYLDSGRTDPSTLDSVVDRLNAEGHAITRNNILNGLALFETPLEDGGAGCIECHGGPEMTTASSSNLFSEDESLLFDPRLERMFMEFSPIPADAVSITYDPSTYTMTANFADMTQEPVAIAVYDTGFYNTGSRPSEEDVGLGGVDVFGNPLSFARLFQLLFPGTVPVAGDMLADADGQILVDLAGPIIAGERIAVDGSFKTPGLRNVELNGPYFHHGGKSTLRQSVAFYNHGSDFPENADLAPLIVPLGLTGTEERDLVAFLIGCTDERVLWERAPFDHPELFLPNGQNSLGVDKIERLAATGAAGSAVPIERFLDLDPFSP